MDKIINLFSRSRCGKNLYIVYEIAVRHNAAKIANLSGSRVSRKESMMIFYCFFWSSSSSSRILAFNSSMEGSCS